MQARYDESIFKKEDSLSDGHRVQFDIILDNGVAEESCYSLNHDFFTKCEIYPTSWNLRMIIRRVKALGKVHIPITLKRDDHRNCVVNASIEATLSNRGVALLGLPRYFEKLRMVSGDKLQANVDGFPQPPHPVTLFDEMLTIRAIVRIRDCHCVVNTLQEENLITENEPSIVVELRSQNCHYVVNKLQEENLSTENKPSIVVELPQVFNSKREIYWPKHKRNKKCSISLFLTNLWLSVRKFFEEK